MQKYVKNEKRYRLINFICLLAVYKNLIGTGRVLSTSILRYVKITMHLQLIFNACAVIVVLLCFRLLQY